MVAHTVTVLTDPTRAMHQCRMDMRLRQRTGARRCRHTAVEVAVRAISRRTTLRKPAMTLSTEATRRTQIAASLATIARLAIVHQAIVHRAIVPLGPIARIAART